MTFAITSVFYFTFGACVATALSLVERQQHLGDRFLRIFASFLFWPLYVPLVLQRTPNAPTEAEVAGTDEPSDSLARSIEQVEAELKGALESLDGWAEGVLIEERERIDELQSAWRAQAGRLRELDRLLTRTDSGGPDQTAGLVEPDVVRVASLTDRRTRCERARSQNVRQLRDLRQRMLDDLMGTLAWVRELVTMIHLAKFSGAPASRAEELVAQIAAAVEGLQEASIFRNNADVSHGRVEVCSQQSSSERTPASSSSFN